MATTLELRQAGFTEDQINANLIRNREIWSLAGFTNSEIEKKTGLSTYNYLQVILSSVNRNLTTITPRLENGESPLVKVGGRIGSFDFNIEGRISRLTPGVQYRFNAIDGTTWNYQLENDYQGGDWQNAAHAKDDYEIYKEWQPFTRLAILQEMWAGSPEIAEFINNSILSDTPWEEVKEGLNQFDTYRQISNSGWHPESRLFSPEEYKKIQQSIMENSKLNIANFDFDLVVSDADVDPETKEKYKEINDLILRYRIDPGLLNKKVSLKEAIELGFNSSIFGLVSNVEALNSGNPEAAKGVVEFFFRTQAIGMQDLSKRVVIDVATVGSDLPFMILPGMAAAWTCGQAFASRTGAAGLPGVGKGVASAAATICGFGAAFGVVGAIRAPYTALLEAGLIGNEIEFIKLIQIGLKQGGKDFVIGMLTGSARITVLWAAKALGVEGAALYSRTAIGSATLTAETATMTLASGYFEGYLPTWDDYIETAAVLLTLRGGFGGVKGVADKITREVRGTEWYIRRNLAQLSVLTGIDPRTVLRHAKEFPEQAKELAHALSSKSFVVPRFYLSVFTDFAVRMEAATRSEVNVKGTIIRVTRHLDVHEGTPTTLRVMGTETLGDTKPTPFKTPETGVDLTKSEAKLLSEIEVLERDAAEFKELSEKKPGVEQTIITFELTENGGWKIIDFEGEINPKQIIAIADYAESQGRLIILDEGFAKISEIIENRSARPETPVSEVDLVVEDIIKNNIENIQILRDQGRKKEANEIEKKTQAMLEKAVGKDYIKTNKKIIEKFRKEQEIVMQEIIERDLFRQTGFHLPVTIIKQQGGANPLERIDKLNIPKLDNQTLEIIGSHAIESIYANTVGKNGFDLSLSKGSIIISSDTHATIRSKVLADPNFIRVHVRSVKPLNLRDYPDFDRLTLGLQNGMQLAAFFHEILPQQMKNHPATFTLEEFNRVRQNPDVVSRTQAAMEVITSKGYDSIIYKNTVEGKVVDDAIAILKTENINILAYKAPKIIDQVTGKAEAKAKAKDVKFQDKEAAWEETPRGEHASDGIYNMDIIEGSPQAEKIMSSVALVELAKILLDGKLPEIVRKFSDQKLRGIFRYQEDASGKSIPGTEKIQLNAAIFKDMKTALKTLAHEIGHLVDWLEGEKNYSMNRGNLIGRLVALKKNMDSYFKGSPGGEPVLTSAEKAQLKKDARKIIANAIKEVTEEDTGLTAQQIKDIFTGVMKRAEVDPEIYKFISGAGRKLKAEITKAAMRKSVYPHIRDIEAKGKGKPKIDPDREAKVKAEYENLLWNEIERRGLLVNVTMENELRTLTQIWKPFDPENNKNYTAYRFSSRELYADFFSAVMTNPHFAKITAPMTYRGFFAWLESKPRFFETYTRLQEEMSTGKTLTSARIELRKGFDDGDAIAFDKFFDRKKWTAFSDYILEGVFDSFWSTIKVVHNYNRRKGTVSEGRNPVRKIDEFRYQGSETEGYMADWSYKVIRIMERNGIRINDLAEYMFHKRIIEERGGIERGEIASPLGFEKESTSPEALADLESKMPELPHIANAFWEIRQEWAIPVITAAKMWHPNLMAKIQNNKVYVKFDVMTDTLTKYGADVVAKLFSQKGTFEGIKNPLTRTIMQDFVLMRAAAKEIAKNKVIEFLKAASKVDDTVPFEKAQKKWVDGRWRLLEPTDKDLGLMLTMTEGKLSGYYIDRKIVESFEKNSIEAEMVVRGMRYTTTPFKWLFTELNYGFWMFNMWRDYMRLIRNIPKKGLNKWIPYWQFFSFMPYYFKATKPAWSSIFGKRDPTGIVRELLKEKSVISIENRWGDRNANTEFERLLQRHGLVPYRYQKVFKQMQEKLSKIENKEDIKLNGVHKKTREFFKNYHNVGQALERTPKVAAHIYLKKEFPEILPSERAHIVRAHAGSPAFLRVGKLTSITNTLLMYSNAMKEGWRGDLEVFRERPTEFAYNVFQYNMIPKILMLMAAKGIFGDEQKTIMDAVSDYDKANFIIIPLGITKKGKAIYLRLPQDETGRFFSGVVWEIFSESDDKQFTDLMNFTAGQIPAMTPVFDVANLLGGYAYDVNPGINQTKWDAEGEYRRDAVLGKVWDTAGGRILFSSRGRFSDNFEELKEELEELLFLPGVQNTLNRFLKVSDRGIEELLDPTTSRQKSAEQSILANRFLIEYFKDGNYKPTQEEREAIFAKIAGLNERYKRIVTNMLGNAMAIKLFNENSLAAQKEILSKIYNLSQKGNLSAKALIDALTRRSL